MDTLTDQLASSKKNMDEIWAKLQAAKTPDDFEGEHQSLIESIKKANQDEIATLTAQFEADKTELGAEITDLRAQVESASIESKVKLNEAQSQVAELGAQSESLE